MTNTSSVVYTAGISAIALLSATWLLVTWLRKKTYKPVARVKKLLIYPIKSLSGIEVDSLVVTRNGVRHGVIKDRSWMLIDAENQPIKLKAEFKLALTKCTIHEGNQVWVDAPQMPTLKLKLIENLDKNCKIVNITYAKEPMEGIDCGDEVNQWFQKYLGEPGIRLIQHHPKLSKPFRPTYSGGRRTDDDKFPVIFQNKSGLHLVTESSLGDLNARIAAANEGSENVDKVPFINFRPNILADGCAPWEEDNWHYININGVELLQLLQCDRCAITDINLSKAEIGYPTLKTLKTFRPTVKTASPCFGVIYGSIIDGKIRVGDVINAADK